MKSLPSSEIEAYLNTGLWEGKAGGFGLQDGIDWISIEHGSLSNVVGLPLELLERLIKEMGITLAKKGDAAYPTAG